MSPVSHEEAAEFHDAFCRHTKTLHDRHVQLAACIVTLRNDPDGRSAHVIMCKFLEDLEEYPQLLIFTLECIAHSMAERLKASADIMETFEQALEIARKETVSEQAEA